MNRAGRATGERRLVVQLWTYRVLSGRYGSTFGSNRPD